MEFDEQVDADWVHVRTPGEIDVQVNRLSCQRAADHGDVQRQVSHIAGTGDDRVEPQ
ncbi:hypothetical protein OHA72_45645 [Dactylosporangium sp. NBC_01737]|uniref:hypothetical protein n=1 Tax=Dactylosporangium sp. NBC_01737 TaxID=2975959 RepID=UPI002E1001E4|nr:hypothetical protein OHA72_45645 [Dactylosporangium sp. NBC_01737]